jgi:hypothetical protein
VPRRGLGQAAAGAATVRHGRKQRPLGVVTQTKAHLTIARIRRLWATYIIGVSTIQQRSNFRTQFAKGERLADHMQTGVEPVVVYDGVARIACREQHS